MSLPISIRFKETRKYIGLNQTEFADELGISQTHISSIENGKENPSQTLLKLICVKFNISEEWLIEGLGNHVRSPDFRVDTDEGLMAKYNAMRANFESALRKFSDKDLYHTVEAFSHFTSLILGAKLSGDDKSMYIEQIYKIIDELEKASFRIHSLKNILPKSQKYRYLYECQNVTELVLAKVDRSTRLAFDQYIKEYKDYKSK